MSRVFGAKKSWHDTGKGDKSIEVVELYKFYPFIASYILIYSYFLSIAYLGGLLYNLILAAFVPLEEVPGGGIAYLYCIVPSYFLAPISYPSTETIASSRQIQRDSAVLSCTKILLRVDTTVATNRCIPESVNPAKNVQSDVIRYGCDKPKGSHEACQ